MKTMIGKIMLGIIVAGTLTGCANVQGEFESALHRNDWEAAEKWLGRGATVNPKRKYEWDSLLGDAAIGHHEEMVYWLLEHGATEANGEFPWPTMAWMGDPELLRFRLKKGVDINAKDDD